MQAHKIKLIIISKFVFHTCAMSADFFIFCILGKLIRFQETFILLYFSFFKFKPLSVPNNLPSVVQPLYVTKASSPSIIIFSNQTFWYYWIWPAPSLYSFKLIWSSPAGLVKGKPVIENQLHICNPFSHKQHNTV